MGFKLNRCNFGWIGRCHEVDVKKNRIARHNKIWGWFYHENDIGPSKQAPVFSDKTPVYTFWGAFGSSIALKYMYEDSDREYFWQIERDLNNLVRSKRSKNYVQISKDELLKEWPDFMDRIEEKLVLHIFKNSDNIFEE